MVTGGKLPSPGLGQARVAVVAPSSGGATRGGSAATTSATAAVQNVLQNAVQQRNKKKQASFARLVGVSEDVQYVVYNIV